MVYLFQLQLPIVTSTASILLAGVFVFGASLLGPPFFVCPVGFKPLDTNRLRSVADKVAGDSRAIFCAQQEAT
jgi:hypothetical protein